MAVKKNNQKMLVKKLKKQVRELQSRETKARNKLRTVLKKLRKQGTAFKRKLTTKARAMESKMADVQTSAYAKIAADLERQLAKGIQAKSKALVKAVSKLEKMQLSKMKKSITKKVKTRKSKKSTKSAKKR